MRRVIAMAAVGVVVGLSTLAGSAFAANDNASCKGILLSSLAGEAGEVAVAVHFVNDLAHALGVPPGVFAHSLAAELHEGDTAACLDALGF